MDHFPSRPTRSCIRAGAELVRTAQILLLPQARTRAQLLAASRSLFANQGIDQTTIGEIAELADTGVGSFYNHFGSKDDVIAALLQDELGIELGVLRDRQSQVDDVAERVSMAHRSLLERIRADSDLGWLIIRLDAVYEIGVNFMREAAVADLKAGIKSKRFKVDDAEVAWRASAGAFLGIAQGVVRGELPESADSAHAAGVLRLFGVSPEEAFRSRDARCRRPERTQQARAPAYE